MDVLPLLLLLLKLMTATAADTAAKEDGSEKAMTVAGNVTMANNDADNNVHAYWSPACPSGFHKQWSTHNTVSVCFRMSGVTRNWNDARIACRNKAAQYNNRCHGDLASILNLEENNFVSTMLGRKSAWFGATIERSGLCTWFDRRQSTWRHFAYGQPRYAGYRGYNCAEFKANRGGYWGTRTCSDNNFFVCKAYCV